MSFDEIQACTHSNVQTGMHIYIEIKFSINRQQRQYSDYDTSLPLSSVFLLPLSFLLLSHSSLFLTFPSHFSLSCLPPPHSLSPPSLSPPSVLSVSLFSPALFFTLASLFWLSVPVCLHLSVSVYVSLSVSKHLQDFQRKGKCVCSVFDHVYLCFLTTCVVYSVSLQHLHNWVKAT